MRSIPEFPSFEVIDVAHRGAVEAFTHAHPPYSDFNFTSLWAWDTSRERMVSQLNGNLVVRFTDYSTNEPFLSFLGTNETEKTARALIDYCKAEGLPTTLKLVPEISTQGMRPSVLKVEEDRDNFDYMCSVSRLAHLEGPLFKGGRNLVHKFMREYPEAHVEIIDLKNKDAQKSIASMLRVWEKNKISGNKEYELEHEEVAIRNLCNTAEAHELLVTGVFLENNMLGFSVDELLPGQNSIWHFCKADVTYAGVYNFLLYEKVRHLETLGIEFINQEQDLGIEGLRKAKLAYQPVSFLKKYDVSLQSE